MGIEPTLTAERLLLVIEHTLQLSPDGAAFTSSCLEYDIARDLTPSILARMNRLGLMRVNGIKKEERPLAVLEEPFSSMEWKAVRPSKGTIRWFCNALPRFRLDLLLLARVLYLVEITRLFSHSRLGN